MADSAATLEAPAAAPPETTPAPTPAASTPDPLMARLFKDLGKLVDADDGKLPDAPPAAPVAAPTPATPAPAPDAPLATATTPPPAPPEPKKVQVKHERPLEQIVDETVAKRLAAQPQPAPATPQPAPTPAAPVIPATDPYESGLGESEKEELELRRFAAARFPDKHRNADKGYVDALKRIDAYIEKARKDDPGRTFDDKDEEFKAFVDETLPALPDRRKLERMQIEEGTVVRVRKEMADEQEKIRHRQERLEAQPHLQRTITEFERDLTGRVATVTEKKDDTLGGKLANAAAALGYDDVSELVDPIVQPTMAVAKTAAEAYSKFMFGMQQFDTSQPEYDWLARFLQQQSAYFEKHAKAEDRVREGKQFMPWVTFNKLQLENPTEAKKYFTFSDGEVLALISENARLAVEGKLNERLSALDKENKRLEKAGYTKRNGAPAPGLAKPAETPVPSAAPKAVTAIAPGTAKIEGMQPQTVMSPSELSILLPGVPMPK